MEGFIQLHRKIIEWEWYDEPNTFRLFLHILLKTNFKDKTWRGILIKRGEYLTSLNKLAEETGLTLQQVRTSLKKLISTHEITKESHTNYTIVKVISYDDYQTSNTQDNKPITNKQHTDNIQVTTTNNVNKENNVNNVNNKLTKIKIFEEYSFEYKICNYFLNFHIEDQTPSIIYLLKNNNKEKIIQKWCDTIKKLKNIDKFTEEQIDFIIKFTVKDEFWKNQILSIEKFRKKKDGISYFVKMIDKAKINNNKTNLKKVGVI